jgi:tyrosyl-tRNA synthetase
MPTLLEVLESRGLLHTATPGLAARLARGPVTGYCGFDPTADSLHAGNLIPVMGLAWLQRTGGRPIALVGGGTGMIGDPSGKRSERPALAAGTITANAAAIRTQLSQFLEFEGPGAARLLDNAGWLQELRVLEFLRDTGKHFTVNYMLQKDSVKSRMETGISYTEFSYMLLQAHDYAHLFRAEGCELQLGGSDQWGNITAGIELIARREGGEAHGVVLPLLTTASGAKFGKSEDGNVWLDPAKTSPYRFYQFWLNSDDRDVERLLKFFTFLPLETIAAVMAEQAADPGTRAAQRRLAVDVTTRIHGEDTTRRVIAASAILFGSGELREADAGTLAMVAGEVPLVELPRGALDHGHPVVDALVATGLASSKGEARRGIEQKGFSVNGRKVAAWDERLGPDDLLAGGHIVLQKGRRGFAVVRIGG